MEMTALARRFLVGKASALHARDDCDVPGIDRIGQQPKPAKRSVTTNLTPPVGCSSGEVHVQQPFAPTW
jgi:hypothetical protein